jgi:ATP-dependent exoDNAse (exonuclease V) beta subunit
MKTFTKLLSISIVAAVALFAIACNGQLGEANRLVDEANVAIKKSNESSGKTTGLIKELFGDLSKVEDLDEYKTTNKAKMDELLKLLEASEKDLSDAGGKFEAASKLDVTPKFKEYLALKGQEIKKRSEHDKATTDFVKAFQAESETEKINTLLGDYNKKSGDINREADDLMKKADQIVKDNPNEFKAK